MSEKWKYDVARNGLTFEMKRLFEKWFEALISSNLKHSCAITRNGVHSKIVAILELEKMRNDSIMVPPIFGRKW